MRRLKIIGGVLVGILILGGVVHEVARPHGQLAEGPRVVQPATPPSIHPNDLVFDVREVREPIRRVATPTSVNTLPAPIGADSSYVTARPSARVDGFVVLLLLAVAGSLAWARWAKGIAAA